MEKSNSISPVCIRRLQIQGYLGYPDSSLNEFRHGIRFAYLGCASLVALGLLLQSNTLLLVAMVVAFLAAVLPQHPFDYLYNNVVRHWIGKPRIPKRTAQGKFACGIATVWLAGIILLLTYGLAAVAYILGGLLLAQAISVGTIDFCIPSLIYNSLFGKSPKIELNQ